MHRGHDHDHDHDGVDNSSTNGPAGPGHNRGHEERRVAQWQVPHIHGDDRVPPADHGEPDLDLIETAFVTGFAAAPDPTSFLRLAQVPFEATAPGGAKLVLLRVETDSVTDVGSVMPHLGGDSLRYDPLPARMVARRARLRFVYYDGTGLRALGLAAVRALRPAVVAPHGPSLPPKA